MTKSIFSATFEESKNLLNDFFYKKDKADQANNEKRFNYNRTKIIIAETLATIFFISFFFILPSFGISYFCTKEASEKGIPNFSPYFVFIAGLILLLIFGIVSLISPKYLKVFWGKFDLSFIGAIWLYIEINALLCSMLYGRNEFYLLVLTYPIILILVIVAIVHRVHLTKTLLYKTKENKLDINFKKIINLLYIIVPIFISGYLIIKFINPNLVKVNLDLTGLIVLMIFLNLGFALFEVYAVSTYLLVGYYYHKYPEEYRKFEKKTYQQWYGKLYMKLKGLHSNNESDK